MGKLQNVLLKMSVFYFWILKLAARSSKLAALVRLLNSCHYFFIKINVGVSALIGVFGCELPKI